MRRVIGSGSGSDSGDKKGPFVFGGRSRRARNQGRKWAPEPAPTRHERSRFVPPTRRYPEQPAESEPPPRVTADQAYTVELQRERRSRATPPVEPGARGYERYGTDGYVRPPGYRPGRSEPGVPPPRAQRPYEPPTLGGYERRGYEPPGRGAAGQEPPGGPRGEARDPGDSETQQMPKKLTVTRVAAMRGRELSERAVSAFQRAHRADGAHESGLTSLSWSLMLNYASDAALAIALANTLFFSAASAESKGKVALYLLVTIAPFAVIAPLIGPALDRIQRGRRLAMAVASAASAVMCLVIAVNFDSWLLYPAALGKMVLSKSFMVLKSAVTPRVVPPDITLSKTNARLTIFGLAAGGVGGGLASLLSWIAGSPGAAWVAAAICVAGAAQAMRIPSWVESTEGEVPATLHSQALRRKPSTKQPITPAVVVALWGNGTIRLLTGFLMLFAAFAVKASAEQNDQGPFTQLLLLGLIGAAAGLGGFVGNGIGSRLHLGRPGQVITIAAAATLCSTVLATILPGIITAALVGLVGATGSALAKISLDAVIQHDLPEQSRASAFGRSETVLQMAWCCGGAIGLLLPPTYWIGFLVVSVLLALGLAQTIMLQRGRTLMPSRAAFGRNKPAEQTAPPDSPRRRPGSAEPPQRPRGAKWTAQ